MLDHQHARASAPPPSELRPARAAKRAGRAGRSLDRQRGSGQAVMTDYERAEAYIAGARECGLVLCPVISLKGRVACAFGGREIDGPNDFDTAWTRFAYHPARRHREALPEGLLGKILCDEFGLDPADPAFVEKVDARMLEEQAAWRAGEDAR